MLHKLAPDEPANIEAVGDTGIAVPAGDVAGFAAAMRRLVSDEPARRELGALARDRVAAQFRADEMARRTAEIYDAV